MLNEAVNNKPLMFISMSHCPIFSHGCEFKDKGQGVILSF